MTTKQINQLTRIFDTLAPINDILLDPRFIAIEKMYRAQFHTTAGLENFIISCGSEADAYEVLMICNTQ